MNNPNDIKMMSKWGSKIITKSYQNKQLKWGQIEQSNAYQNVRLKWYQNESSKWYLYGMKVSNPNITMSNENDIKMISKWYHNDIKIS